MVSIIVPLYNESRTLEENQKHFRRLAESAEVIFVDGASEDGPRDKLPPNALFLESERGRDRQMNRGASHARGDILFFLHADCRIDETALASIESAVRDLRWVGGCLSQSLEPSTLLFRWIGWTGNVRAKLTRVFYGDQGIFVRKDVFESIGGFPRVSLCEDVYFSRKLRRAGKTGLLKDRIYCSARRWIRQGILRTFLQNQKIYWSLFRGAGIDKSVAEYTDVR